jgi:cytochrome oxidase assembly protein ShyY1
MLLGMGMWQVQRFFYKSSVIESLKESSSNVDVFLETKDMQKKVNHKVKIEGEFISGETIFWYRLQKNKIGYNLVVPFKMRDGVILVDLGWSTDKKDVVVKKGKHVLTGYLLNFYGPSKFIVDNDIKGKTWFRLDKDEISQYLGYSIVPFVLKVMDSGYLVGNYDFIPKEIVNNHMYYAVMWFALGIIWVVLMFIYNKKNI